MLHCNINNIIPTKEKNMDWNSLTERLREMFPNQFKSDLDRYLESKNIKNASDVEHWIRIYTYYNHKDYVGF